MAGGADEKLDDELVTFGRFLWDQGELRPDLQALDTNVAEHEDAGDVPAEVWPELLQRLVERRIYDVDLVGAALRLDNARLLKYLRERGVRLGRVARAVLEKPPLPSEVASLLGAWVATNGGGTEIKILALSEEARAELGVDGWTNFLG